MLFHDLTTPRLRLTGIAPTDRDFILRQFSDPDVTRYLYDEEPFRTLDEADGLIEFYTQPEPREQHRWILRLRDEPIGTVGFHRWDSAAGVAEMGYDLQPAYQRQGLMTEAAIAALAFARDDMRLTRVLAHISTDNVASTALARKLGFAPTDEIVTYTFRGARYDHRVFAREQGVSPLAS